MSQFDQMSDAEIDARFRISGPKPVAFLLAGYVKAREPFSVHFQHGEEMFLSTLLDAQADKKRLVFDCSGSQETNRRVLARIFHKTGRISLNPLIKLGLRQ